MAFCMHHPCMHTLYAACLPVAAMTVPIQVWVDGQGNLCPSQKGASNDLTRFVETEIVEQYRHIMNCSTCRLSGVQLTLCSSESEQREGVATHTPPAIASVVGTLYALSGGHCVLPDRSAAVNHDSPPHPCSLARNFSPQALC